VFRHTEIYCISCVQKRCNIQYMLCSDTLQYTVYVVFRHTAIYSICCVQTLCYIQYMLCSDTLQYTVYVVFRHTEIYSVCCVQTLCNIQYMLCSDTLQYTVSLRCTSLNLSQAPSSFYAPYIKPTAASPPACTLLVSFCCLHFFSSPINYTKH
jgi:hypothetical protein